ncbi:hypothetical protein B0H12DRAFT_1069863 [Mycena haematopus]|nr:hypothetical protein B0H12DRAFT_1079169 [Mycena haematopus]KAJ7259963.1 hypothetical protein B0H12DRAFT_1069863 [Mycena haematopus]
MERSPMTRRSNANEFYDTCSRTLQRVDQILVHQLHNAYQERPGFVYCNIRSLPGTERVIVKVGRTNNIERRMGEYARCGPGQVFWISYYATGRAKATERIIHLRLEQAGVRIPPFICGCGTMHREYACYEAVGELANVEFVIEETLRSLGQYVFRHKRSHSQDDLIEEQDTRRQDRI